MKEPYGNPGCVCPFCGDSDFDLIGLKLHFLLGFCEVWNATECAPPVPVTGIFSGNDAVVKPCGDDESRAIPGIVPAAI